MHLHTWGRNKHSKSHPNPCHSWFVRPFKKLSSSRSVSSPAFSMPDLRCLWNHLWRLWSVWRFWVVGVLGAAMCAGDKRLPSTTTTPPKKWFFSLRVNSPCVCFFQWRDCCSLMILPDLNGITELLLYYCFASKWERWCFKQGWFLSAHGFEEPLGLELCCFQAMLSIDGQGLKGMQRISFCWWFLLRTS